MLTIRNTLIAFGAALSLTLAASAGAAQAQLGGVPMSEYHMKALGAAAQCKTCHGVAVPTERPSDKACVACHGTMDKIPTKPNKFDKFPHASEHYGNTLECTACHAEHQKSYSVCNDCHVVEWTKKYFQ